MARIRHVAIRTNQPEKLAGFYRDTFGLEEVFRHKSARSDDVAVYLTDGELNLAILPTRDPRTEGLDHFGFHVDDVDAVAKSALTHGASVGPQRVPQDGRQNEAYIADPVGQRIDLSSTGWNIGGRGRAHIRHIAIKTDDPAKLADFYVSTFGLTEILRRPRERGSVYLSDGYVNLAILPTAIPGSNDSPTGLDHFGFHVDDVAAATTTACANGAKPSTHAVSPGAPFAETFFFDPVGQRVDLSQAGWNML